MPPHPPRHPASRGGLNSSRMSWRRRASLATAWRRSSSPQNRPWSSQVVSPSIQPRTCRPCASRPADAAQGIRGPRGGAGACRWYQSRCRRVAARSRQSARHRSWSQRPRPPHPQRSPRDCARTDESAAICYRTRAASATARTVVLAQSELLSRRPLVREYIENVHVLTLPSPDAAATEGSLESNPARRASATEAARHGG